MNRYIEHLRVTFPAGLDGSSTYKRLTQNFAGTNPFPVDVWGRTAASIHCMRGPSRRHHGRSRTPARAEGRPPFCERDHSSEVFVLMVATGMTTTTHAGPTVLGTIVGCGAETWPGISGSRPEEGHALAHSGGAGVFLHSMLFAESGSNGRSIRSASQPSVLCHQDRRGGVDAAPRSCAGADPALGRAIDGGAGGRTSRPELTAVRPGTTRRPCVPVMCWSDALADGSTGAAGQSPAGGCSPDTAGPGAYRLPATKRSSRCSRCTRSVQRAADRFR